MMKFLLVIWFIQTLVIHRASIGLAQSDHRYDDHNFRECDDLFLSDDFRLNKHSNLPPGAVDARQRRFTSSSDYNEQLEQTDIQNTPIAEPLTLDRAAQVQTIYFGGFFPWLADEQTQSSPETGNQRKRIAGLGGRKHKLASAAASTTAARSSVSPTTSTTIDGASRVKNNDENVLASSEGSLVKHRKSGKKADDSGASNNNQGRNQDKSAALLMGPPDVSNQETNNQTTTTTRAIVSQTGTQQQLASGTTTATQFTNSETRHQLGKFISPAVRLALDHINTNRTILSAYKLEVVPRDTQCNATISLKQFFDMVYEEPKKMLLYGDACRVSTDPIAKASYFFDLIQISYADTDPIYTIENYPNFFRVVPSENALSLARIPFIRHFNWTRVGTIYQNLPRYSLPHSKLLTDLERFKIVIKQSVSLPGSVDGLQDRDLGDELRKLKEKDVRIILGNFDEEWALLLFCEAFREKMIGRKYQWLLTGFSESKLWHFYESKGSTCTKQELLVAMDGYIITDITPVTRSQHRTISGLMAHEYLDEYRRRAREMNISIGENKFYGYVYDGIWAIALALNRVDSMLKHYSRLAHQGKVKLKPEFANISSLLDFEYHQPIWVKLIRSALDATRFEGVTGTVSFQKNERPGLITFSQFQAFRDMNEVIIGSYDALIDELDLSVGFPIIWRGSLPPIDYTIQRITPFRINRTLFVIISIMALLGIVLACVFLFVNIKFRDQRYIKMSSPYLNNLIIIGCILTFTSVIILGLDSGLTSEYNFPYICNARAWVLMAGFTLAFGSMFSKTFRVHSIFTNIKLHKKVIKDYKLFMVVFILLTFDVCILIVWQYFDPFYRETNNGTSIQDPDNEDVIIVPEMEHCQSKRMTIFLSVIYVYKGLLMAFGCFLAWETRHVSIPALNDSKYIGLSVYNVVIMCVIGASLSFILRDQQDASFVIISIFIIFCSTTTLCLVFVPKVRMLMELKQNPRAGDHRVRATLKNFKKSYHDETIAANCRDIHGNIIGRAYGMNLNDRIKIVVEENVKQRASLKEKTFELEALTSKYRRIQSMVQSGQYLQAISTSSAPLGGIGGGGGGGPSASGLASTATCVSAGGVASTLLHGKQPVAGTSSPLAMASSSMMLTSGGGGGATCSTTLTSTTTATTTVATAMAAGSPLASGPLSQQTTTVLLKKKAAPTKTTREQVSFRALNDDDLPLANSVNAATHHDGGGGGGGGLRTCSPMMSSVTQITNTTTTSSSTANYNTDLTADLTSSSRALISMATTSGSTASGCGQQCLGSGSGGVFARAACHYDDAGADIQERVQAISRQVAASKHAAAAAGPAQHNKQSLDLKRAATSSAQRSRRSIDSISRQSLFTSQDDLDLFTILSHGKAAANKKNLLLNNSGTRRRASQRHCDSVDMTTQRQEEEDENYDISRKMDQWLEGPFSMLVLRQQTTSGGPAGAAGGATGLLQDGHKGQQARNHHRQMTGGKDPVTGRARDLNNRYASLRKQMSQQTEVGQLQRTAPASRSGALMSKARERLPRTLSMIEYLGLNDLDLIARRHDKILRYRRNMSRFNCCASCSCYLSQQQQQQQQQRGAAGSTHQVVCADHATNDKMKHLQMSEGNLRGATTFLGGSSDPLNDSDDFLQTTSLISCSTCCSLASQTYASHSDLYHHHNDDDGDDDDDDGSCITRSSSSGEGGRVGAESSRTISTSSTASESSSAFVIGCAGANKSRAAANAAAAACRRHYQRPHHGRHQPRSSDSQSECAGGGAHSLSQSSSLLTLNQVHGGSCIMHHNQHHHQNQVHGKQRHDTDQHCHRSSSSEIRDKLQQQKQPDHDHHHDHHHHHHHHHHLHHLRHHLSSEALSTQSNSSTSNATQIVTAQERHEHVVAATQAKSAHHHHQHHHQDPPKQELGSLCTSGVLYGAPGAKEDANDSAHIVAYSSEPIASTSGGAPAEKGQAATNDDKKVSEPEKQDDTVKRRTPKRRTTELSIRCDILEEL